MLLSACGGGNDAQVPEAFLKTSQARTDRSILQAPAAAEAVSATPVPTATELMDWAEAHYAALFPGHEPDLTLPPYVYRHYAATGNYLGVAGSDIYLLGPASENVLLWVGTLADFAPLVLVTHYAFSDAQAARFLMQATLAPSDAEIANLRAIGYAAWLDQQFAKPVSSSNWDWLVSKGLDTNPDAVSTAIGVDAQVWQRLLTAGDSLRQRVTLALSEIFVVGFDGISGPYKQFKLAAYWDLLVSNAFGSFRTLIEQVTLNPAMGGYLNTAGNQKEDTRTGRLPDENYAREVMQLFTIGLYALNADGTPELDGSGQPIESYTQDMVTQLARVFTGWNLNRPKGETGPEFTRRPMVLNAALHSTLSASFLGTTVPANTDGAQALATALNTLANHANVGPFIGTRLIQRLVTSNPSNAYVARVSAAFNDNGLGVRGDLKAVLRAILLDEEARSDAGLGMPAFGKLREPMLRFIHWARVFKATSASTEWNVGNTSDPGTRLGQSPQRSPSVFNYFRPGYVPPNSAIATQVLQAPEFQITHESSVAGYLNYMQTAIGNGHADILPNYSAELALATNPSGLVDRLDRLLCAYQLSAATRSLIITTITGMAGSSDKDKANRVYAAVLLVMASPDYLVQR
ncbi:DUF1800 domain-containing protein [Aquabacterium sp.]|uniref:DUF1800 domain-containing protein n=1 Tax=Aquabacterium sp. TaxID=1872578 RepID=UPI002C340F9F|nr:DUF1800 domain-containing protein [Aquabacterium sp.]HSW03742.1 DUF1800 domain-containing protein [Aquabacterium sp.]